MLSGERVPSASFRSRSLAAARNPIRTSGLANFSHAALLVTVMSQISGTAVTQAYFNLFDLMRIPVATHSAIADRI